MQAIPRVVILGGGFGGLETAFYLRHRAGDNVAITLVSDQSAFVFKPNTIYIPFGKSPKDLLIQLEKPLAKRKIAFEQGRAIAVDPKEKTVTVAEIDGGDRKVSYDYLVVATGAGMRPAEVPGLTENALTIWSIGDMLRLRDAYARLLRDAKHGERRRVLFLVPPNNKCSGPLYEMVQMLDTWLTRKRVRKNVELTWSTYEAGYIQAFGPRLNEAVTEEFARRGITGQTRYAVSRVEPGRVYYSNGESLPYDLLVSFPPYVAASPFEGLPADDRGFIKTHLPTRQVVGQADIYAVGDAGDFPVKQAFLAFLQADAAADHLAARILTQAPRVRFEPTSMCVMEQLNMATFAQVPLRLTGNAARPIEVDTANWGAYRVGSSVVWRAGKWLLGVYLPWRFGAGKPFHAGLPWRLMEIGLKIMARFFATTTPRPPLAAPVQIGQPVQRGAAGAGRAA